MRLWNAELGAPARGAGDPLRALAGRLPRPLRFLGVGGLKMKLHKAAIRRLFESNDLVLDAEQIYELGNQV